MKGCAILRLSLLALALLASHSGKAVEAGASADTPTASGGDAASASRSGLEIHQRFRAHLAEPDCSNVNPRFRAQFAPAPRRMAQRDDELMALFGYVTDELIKAGLPTEYALIPFVESGYNPAARNPQGPAGLWQFIAQTARNQGIVMQPGYDGRYSPVESTRAAIRYLKILHSMFGGNWRVAVMAYNAGEGRIQSAIRRSGQPQRNADASRIEGGPAISRAYVEKLHAISCLLEQADDRREWLAAIDRPVPNLVAEPVHEGIRLEDWARARQHNIALLRKLNPALAQGTISSGRLLLVPGPASDATSPRAATASRTASSVIASGSAAATLSGAQRADGNPRRHTVVQGDSLWSISRRHRISTAELLRLNNLKPGATLRPGMVLRLDATPD